MITDKNHTWKKISRNQIKYENPWIYPLPQNYISRHNVVKIQDISLNATKPLNIHAFGHNHHLCIWNSKFLNVTRLYGLEFWSWWFLFSLRTFLNKPNSYPLKFRRIDNSRLLSIWYILVDRQRYLSKPYTWNLLQFISKINH